MLNWYRRWRAQRWQQYSAAHPQTILSILRTDAGQDIAVQALKTLYAADEAARRSILYPQYNQLGYGGSRPLQRNLPKPTPYNLRRFSQYPPARKAINAITNPILEMDWTIEPIPDPDASAHDTNEPTGDQKQRLVIARRILTEPNNDDSWRILLEQVAEDVVVGGYGAIEMQDSTDPERPVWLWPVDGQSIRINTLWDGQVSTPRYGQSLSYVGAGIGTQDVVQLRDDELIYMRLNPRTHTPFGLGYLEVAFEVVNAFIGAFEYSERRASNSTPNYMIFLGENLPPEQVYAFRQYWENEIEGFGKIPILGGGRAPDVKPFHGDTSDPLWLAWQEWLVRVIAMAFGLSPFKLGLERDVNRNCYSADTETLTSTGWKTLEQLTVNDLVATLNPVTEEIEYREPEDLHVAPYVGNMVHFASKHVDTLVTPDHRMYARSKPRNNIETVYGIHAAQDMMQPKDIWLFKSSVQHSGIEEDAFTLPGCKVFGGPKGDYPDRDIPMDTWLKFLGYWIAEGHAKRYGKGTWKVNICQHEDSPWATDIEDVVKSLPVDFHANHSAVDHCQRWQVADKALCQWLLAECGAGSHTKRLPDFVWRLSKRQLTILYNALIAGDGTRDPNPNSAGCTYYTASKELADDVQLLACMLGHRAAVGNNTPTLYRVSITEGCAETSITAKEGTRHPSNINTVAYDGLVYCFSVPPHHLFLTRRNGKIAIHGNTSDAQQAADWDSIAPVAGTIGDYLTRKLLWQKLGWRDLRFRWLPHTTDEHQQAEVLQLQWQMDAITQDEIRQIYKRPSLGPDGGKTMSQYQAAMQTQFGPKEPEFGGPPPAAE